MSTRAFIVVALISAACDWDGAVAHALGVGGGTSSGGGGGAGGGAGATGGGAGATGGGAGATGGGTAAAGGGTSATGGGTSAAGGGTAATGGGTAATGGGTSATGGGSSATGGGTSSGPNPGEVIWHRQWFGDGGIIMQSSASVVGVGDAGLFVASTAFGTPTGATAIRRFDKDGNFLGIVYTSIAAPPNLTVGLGVSDAGLIALDVSLTGLTDGGFQFGAAATATLMTTALQMPGTYASAMWGTLPPNRGPYGATSYVDNGALYLSFASVTYNAAVGSTVSIRPYGQSPGMGPLTTYTCPDTMGEVVDVSQITVASQARLALVVSPTGCVPTKDMVVVVETDGGTSSSSALAKFTNERTRLLVNNGSAAWTVGFDSGGTLRLAPFDTGTYSEGTSFIATQGGLFVGAVIDPVTDDIFTMLEVHPGSSIFVGGDSFSGSQDAFLVVRFKNDGTIAWNHLYGGQSGALTAGSISFKDNALIVSGQCPATGTDPLCIGSGTGGLGAAFLLSIQP